MDLAVAVFAAQVSAVSLTPASPPFASVTYRRASDDSTPVFLTAGGGSVIRIFPNGRVSARANDSRFDAVVGGVISIRTPAGVEVVRATLGAGRSGDYALIDRVTTGSFRPQGAVFTFHVAGGTAAATELGTSDYTDQYSDAGLSPRVGRANALAVSGITGQYSEGVLVVAEVNRNFSTAELRSASSSIDPQGGFTDGTTAWIVDADGRAVWAFTLASRARDSSKDLSATLLRQPTLMNPVGGFTDGTTAWIVDSDNDAAWAFTLATRRRDSSKDLSASLLRSADISIVPTGGFTDGTTAWITSSWDSDGTQFDAAWAFTLATRARDSSKDITTSQLSPDGNHVAPQGGFTDGETIWIVDLASVPVLAFDAATGDAAPSQVFSDRQVAEAAGITTPPTPPDVSPKLRGGFRDGLTAWLVDSANVAVWAVDLFTSLSVTDASDQFASAELTNFDAAPAFATLTWSNEISEGNFRAGHFRITGSGLRVEAGPFSAPVDPRFESRVGQPIVIRNSDGVELYRVTLGAWHAPDAFEPGVGFYRLTNVIPSGTLGGVCSFFDAEHGELHDVPDYTSQYSAAGLVAAPAPVVPPDVDLEVSGFTAQFSRAGLAVPRRLAAAGFTGQYAGVALTTHVAQAVELAAQDFTAQYSALSFSHERLLSVSDFHAQYSDADLSRPLVLAVSGFAAQYADPALTAFRGPDVDLSVDGFASQYSEAGLLAGEMRLGAPGAPTATATGNEQLTLSTTPVTGELPAQYRWRLSANAVISDDDTVLITDTPSVIFTGLTPSTPYWADVRAEADDLISPYSPSAEFQTTGPAPRTLALPGGVWSGPTPLPDGVTAPKGLALGATGLLLLAGQRIYTLTGSGWDAGFAADFEFADIAADADGVIWGTHPAGDSNQGIYAYDTTATTPRWVKTALAPPGRALSLEIGPNGVLGLWYLGAARQLSQWDGEGARTVLADWRGDDATDPEPSGNPGYITLGDGDTYWISYGNALALAEVYGTAQMRFSLPLDVPGTASVLSLVSSSVGVYAVTTDGVYFYGPLGRPQAPPAPELATVTATSVEVGYIANPEEAPTSLTIEYTSQTGVSTVVVDSPPASGTRVLTGVSTIRASVRYRLTNAAGDGDYGPSASIGLDAPEPPVDVHGEPGDEDATVSWQPSSTGGLPSEYEVRIREEGGEFPDWPDTAPAGQQSPGGFSGQQGPAARTATPQPPLLRQVGGLTNGFSYYAQVRARNQYGVSGASAEAGPIVPYPQAPPGTLPSSARELVVRPRGTTSYTISAGGASGTAQVTNVAEPDLLGPDLARVIVELGYLNQYGEFAPEANANFISDSLKWRQRAHVESTMSATLRADTLADAQALLLYSAVRIRRQRGEILTTDFTGTVDPRKAHLREEGDNRTWLVDIGATTFHREAANTLLLRAGTTPDHTRLDLALDWDDGVPFPADVSASSPSGLAVTPDGQTLYFADGTLDKVFRRSGGSWDAGVDLPQGVAPPLPGETERRDESLPSGIAWDRYESRLFLAGNTGGKIYGQTASGWDAGVEGPGGIMVGLAINTQGNPVTTAGNRIHTLGEDGVWTSFPGPQGHDIFDVDVLDTGEYVAMSRTRIFIYDRLNGDWVVGAEPPDGEGSATAIESRGRDAIYLAGAETDRIYTAAIPAATLGQTANRIYGEVKRTLYHRTRALASHARLRMEEFGPVVLVDARDWPARKLEVRSAARQPLSYLDALRLAASSLGDGWQIDTRGRFKPLLHSHFPAWIADPFEAQWGLTMRGIAAKAPRRRDFELLDETAEVGGADVLHTDENGNFDYEAGRVLEIGRYDTEYAGEQAVLVRLLVLDPGGRSARYPIPPMADPVLARVGVVRIGGRVDVSETLSSRVGESDEALPGIWSLTDTHVVRDGPLNAGVTGPDANGAAQRSLESGWRFSVIVDLIERIPALQEVRLNSFEPIPIGRRFEIVGSGGQAVQLRCVGLEGSVYTDPGADIPGQTRVQWTISAVQATALSESTDGLDLFKELKDRQGRDE